MSTSELGQPSRDEKRRSGVTDRRSAEAPFSDLINQWLAEGDRISEVARTVGAQAKERRLFELLRDLRGKADRHRFVVVFGAIALSAIAVIAMRAFSHAVLRTDNTVAAQTVAAQTVTAQTVAAQTVAAQTVATHVVRPEPAVIVATAQPAPSADPSAPSADPSAPSADPPAPSADPPAPSAASSTASPAHSAAPPAVGDPVAPATDPPASPPPTPAPTAVASAPAADPPVSEHPPLPVTARPAPAPRRPGLAAKTAPVSTRDPLEACQSDIRWERARDALISCDKLTRESPKSADAVVLLAHANLLAGRDGETLRLARRASAIDPNCAEAYLLIGNVQQAAGRMPDARTAYEAYLRTAPRGAHAADVRAILKSLL